MTQQSETKNTLSKLIYTCAGQMPPNMAPVRGITSQPSMSAKLMRADTIPRGSSIWVEDDEEVWVVADVIRQQNTLLTVRRKKTGEELEIDLVRCVKLEELTIGSMGHKTEDSNILYTLGRLIPFLGRCECRDDPMFVLFLAAGASLARWRWDIRTSLQGSSS